MKKLVFYTLFILSLFTSCHNQDWSFPDYTYTTVYFPYQTPVRTIVLGKDSYDNSIDKLHRCRIMATMGGVYNNTIDRTLTIAVDNSLCDNVKFESDSGDVVQPMPTAFYSLDQKMKIIIPKDSVSSGIQVQLTDAFFNDPNSIKNTYVIPLRITDVQDADSILSGAPLVSNPNPLKSSDWGTAPKNYVLYCIKYVNPWHGAYLRRGVDIGKGNSGNSTLDTTITYHKEYVERDQVVKMYTQSMDEVSLAMTTRDKGNGTDIPFELRIKVDGSGKCTVSNPASASYKISGTGDFVENGDMWGNEKHDVMHLKYQIEFGSSTHSFTDTLVIRDRQVKFETFSPVVL
jgi:hypothetical protein